MAITVHAKEENGIHYLNWKDRNKSGYKLAEIAQPNGFLNDLPYAEEFVSFAQLKEKDNCLVTSELSGGRMSLIQAYQAYLETEGICWIFVKAGAWDRVVFQSSTNSEPSEEFLTAVEALKTEKGIGARMDLLKTWLTSEIKKGQKPEKVVLIIRDVSTLDELDSIEITNVFRQLYDTGIGERAKGKLNILIVDAFESVFADAAVTSGYAGLCYQYRLPFFDTEDLKILVDKMELNFTAEPKQKESKAETNRKALIKLLDHTGGQPLLVQDFLRRLQQLNKSITPRQMDRVAKNMRSNPPVITKKWQEELKKILTDEPELIHPLQAYVSGFSLSAMRFPPPAQERSLYLAGWLKLSHERWGISSSLHTDLARRVLEQMAGGLSHE